MVPRSRDDPWRGGASLQPCTFGISCVGWIDGAAVLSRQPRARRLRIVGAASAVLPARGRLLPGSGAGLAASGFSGSPAATEMLSASAPMACGWRHADGCRRPRRASDMLTAQRPADHRTRKSSLKLSPVRCAA